MTAPVSIILSSDELITITGRRNRSAQIRQLQRMGIEHKQSADGNPIVSRIAFEQSIK